MKYHLLKFWTVQWLFDEYPVTPRLLAYYLCEIFVFTSFILSLNKTSFSPPADWKILYLFKNWKI